MFKPRPLQADGPVDTLIGPQVDLHGELRFSGTLVVEGRITGRVVAEPGEPAILTIAEQGVVEGEVEAPVVIVHGRLAGDLRASERVELAGQARVDGDVFYRLVEMRAGAVLTGRLVHVDGGADDAAAVPAGAGLRAVPDDGERDARVRAAG